MEDDKYEYFTSAHLSDDDGPPVGYRDVFAETYNCLLIESCTCKATFEGSGIYICEINPDPDDEDDVSSYNHGGVECSIGEEVPSDIEEISPAWGPGTFAP
ncbi:hypothetical protein [Mariniblastus fucicola]|uniref:Uncharacterized protein n=1 Tax=Mariniblastus fucicola TaxID=980251 RepID=A0A5B9PEW3_9BACT|nr:hypothetical protein [Mariniblastus fucicola]QEG24079.1 hypothetical protein MFFC18_39950 [Mariniblastus fucicola]